MIMNQTNHVLLVDDDPANERLMFEAFKKAASESTLHAVENGDDAIKFLKREAKFADAPKPSLIILDLNLPGKNGFEILEDIKKIKELKNVPVLILTGSSAAGDIQNCSRLYCKYLLKPTRFHELVQLVKSLPDFY